MSIVKMSRLLSGISYLKLYKREIRLFPAYQHWNKDYKPGPYPKTQEEKVAAAKKYGIPLEEYKTYPDDGNAGLGDYPKMHEVSADCRDPFYPWDKPEWAKNYKEPLHYQEQLMDFFHYDTSKRHRTSIPKSIFQFFFAVGSAFALMWVSSKYKMFLPAFPRQYLDEPHFYFETGHGKRGGGGHGGDAAKSSHH